MPEVGADLLHLLHLLLQQCQKNATELFQEVEDKGLEEPPCYNSRRQLPTVATAAAVAI